MTHEKCCGGSSNRTENNLPFDTPFCQVFCHPLVPVLVANEPDYSLTFPSIPGLKKSAFLALTKLSVIAGTAWSLSLFLTQKTATL